MEEPKLSNFIYTQIAQVERSTAQHSSVQYNTHHTQHNRVWKKTHYLSALSCQQP